MTDRVIPDSREAATMTAQEAMHELWGTFCPDCGPDDYAGIVKALVALKAHCPHMMRLPFEPDSSFGDESDFKSRCAGCGAILRMEPNR